MSKITFTPEDYKEAAVQYRKQLLMLPIRGIKKSLEYMTGRPGIRYAERVGDADMDAQFAPYKPAMRSNANLTIKFRELRTYFGACVVDFEPNQAISTLLGIGAASKGDAQMQAPTAMLVLCLIAKKLAKSLDRALFFAKRNPDGNTTMDLFDGFDTITGAEIEAGNISAELGNYLKLSAPITVANAVETAQQIMYALHDELRASTEPVYIYCTQDFVDKYNKAYKLETGATAYNREYDQVAVEGSNGMLVFCPMPNKRGTKYFQVCAKSNMLVGYDQLSDSESVSVEKYAPFILTYIATMFFGVQFETLDQRCFMVVELADETSKEKPQDPPEEDPVVPGGEVGGEGGQQGGQQGEQD